MSRYLPRRHAVQARLAGDVRGRLQEAALGQPWIGQAAATFVIAAAVDRTEAKYGRRAERYVLVEVGRAAGGCP